jgi:hypothetical protein
MRYKNYILGLLIVPIILAAGCVVKDTPASDTPTSCNAPFFISERENLNQTISDMESAYKILINLEPGWSQDSDLYKDYKNSKVSDVTYQEISISGLITDSGFPKIYAYVLKDNIAVDSKGQIYRKGGCM